MPARIDLVLYQNNAETIAITVVQEQGGAPQDLTGKTLRMLIKPTQNTPDADPSVVVLSSSGGSPAIVITSATGGTATVTVPASDLANFELAWWRLDVVEDQKTVMYGSFTVQPV